MKALVIDLGRMWVRYGLVSDDDMLTEYDKIETPLIPFDDTVALIANKLNVDIRGKILAVAAPGPFYGASYEPLNMATIDFSVDRLAERFTEKLVVVHDVIGGALGASLIKTPKYVHLPAKGLRVEARSPRAFIQTGVGLGAAMLLPVSESSWLPVSGEGGSASIGALYDGTKSSDWEKVLDEFKAGPGDWGHVTAQALLSSDALHRYGKALGVDFADGKTETIIDAANAKNAGAERVLNTYAGFLAVFAADMALIYRAYGGVSIAGPVPAALTKEAQKIFVKRFHDRGTVSDQLRRIPVDFINDEFLTLSGLASLCVEM